MRLSLAPSAADHVHPARGHVGRTARRQVCEVSAAASAGLVALWAIR